MKESRSILLTFDYEPYLGRKSGTSDKCILEPTNALRLILNKHKAKAVFFVDILFLKNLKEYPELKSDYEKITNQLTTLFNEGHYIFPHIHPHWLDAGYEKDTAQFNLNNLSRYSLAKFSEEEIRKMFLEAISFFRENGITYTSWGYRAGGWCIQPFTLFKNAFIENNIEFEFSVLPGYKNENENQHFDFSTIKETRPYFFSDEVDAPTKEGRFLEFPISTISLSSLVQLKDKLVRKYLWKTGDKGWGDGLSAQTAALKSNNNKREMISIDVFNISKLKSYKKFIRTCNYMHWISHPKMFTRHGLRTFDQFLLDSNKKFELEFDFKKIRAKQ